MPSVSFVESTVVVVVVIVVVSVIGEGLGCKSFACRAQEAASVMLEKRHCLALFHTPPCTWHWHAVISPEMTQSVEPSVPTPTQAGQLPVQAVGAMGAV